METNNKKGYCFLRQIRELYMSNNMITKDALGKALKVLLEKKPLSKISVKDITEYCNISRNTFIIILRISMS